MATLPKRGGSGRGPRNVTPQASSDQVPNVSPARDPGLGISPEQFGADAGRGLSAVGADLQRRADAQAATAARIAELDDANERLSIVNGLRQRIKDFRIKSFEGNRFRERGFNKEITQFINSEVADTLKGYNGPPEGMKRLENSVEDIRFEAAGELGDLYTTGQRAARKSVAEQDFHTFSEKYDPEKDDIHKVFAEWSNRVNKDYAGLPFEDERVMELNGHVDIAKRWVEELMLAGQLNKARTLLQSRVVRETFEDAAEDDSYEALQRNVDVAIKERANKPERFADKMAAFRADVEADPDLTPEQKKAFIQRARSHFAGFEDKVLKKDDRLTDTLSGGVIAEGKPTLQVALEEATAKAGTGQVREITPSDTGAFVKLGDKFFGPSSTGQDALIGEGQAKEKARVAVAADASAFLESGIATSHAQAYSMALTTNWSILPEDTDWLGMAQNIINDNAAATTDTLASKPQDVEVGLRDEVANLDKLEREGKIDLGDATGLGSRVASSMNTFFGNIPHGDDVEKFLRGALRFMGADINESGSAVETARLMIGMVVKDYVRLVSLNPRYAVWEQQIVHGLMDAPSIFEPEGKLVPKLRVFSGMINGAINKEMLRIEGGQITKREAADSINELRTLVSMRNRLHQFNIGDTSGLAGHETPRTPQEVDALPKAAAENMFRSHGEPKQMADWLRSQPEDVRNAWLARAEREGWPGAPGQSKKKSQQPVNEAATPSQEGEPREPVGAGSAPAAIPKRRLEAIKALDDEELAEAIAEGRREGTDPATLDALEVEMRERSPVLPDPVEPVEERQGIELPSMTPEAGASEFNESAPEGQPEEGITDKDKFNAQMASDDAELVAEKAAQAEAEQAENETRVKIADSVVHWESRDNPPLLKPKPDNRGVVVSHGFNLDTHPKAREWVEAEGVDFDALRAGKASITEDQAQNLFIRALDMAEEDARKFVGSDVYDGLSDNRKIVMVNMAYQLGLTSLVGTKTKKGFDDFKASVKAGDFRKAAKDMLNSDWATHKKKGDPKRARALAKLMRDG